MKGKTLTLACLAVAALLLGGAAPDRAGATFPGGNGKIAFTSNRDGNGEVHVMNADGSGETNLTQNAADDTFPAWSPDGSKIAFTSNRDGNSEVHVMNADGSVQTNLTQNAAIDSLPAWQTLPSADLALGMAATAKKKNDRSITYTITVQNVGPSNAHEVVVTDTLPPETRFVSATPSQGSCVAPPPGSTGTVTCNLGFLVNSTSATAGIEVTVVVRKTSVSNTASVKSSTPDPNLANNSATITTYLR